MIGYNNIKRPSILRAFFEIIFSGSSLTFRPRTPACRRASRELELNALSGTKPPQNPVEAKDENFSLYLEC